MKRQILFEYASECGVEAVDIRQTDRGRVCYTLLRQACARPRRVGGGLVMLRLAAGGRGDVKFFSPNGESLTVKY